MDYKEKLIPCPYMVVRRKTGQDLESLLDEWRKKVIKEKRMFSSKIKKKTSLIKLEKERGVLDREKT